MFYNAYVTYLETVVLSLLEERGTDASFPAIETASTTFKDCEFSPINVRSMIQQQKPLAEKVDNNLIGRNDAECPKCGNNFGEFCDIDGFAALKCGNCGYKGLIREFVSAKKMKELAVFPRLT